MTWDVVHTVHAYYDGPRFGIANFNGKPHIYESAFDDMLDDYPDTYKLSEINELLLVLVMADWTIWEKWERAFKAGKVEIDSHPCLPEDRIEHERLRAEIGDIFRIDDNRFIERKANFRQNSIEPRRFEVEWIV